MNVVPTVLLSALVSTGAHGDIESGAAPSPAYVHCTTGSYRVAGEPEQRATHPIARALERARPGTPIYLDPGQYQAFTIGLESSSKANARTSGGRPGAPIVVQGTGQVRIQGKWGDTIGIAQQVPNGHITFRNLEIVPAERSGIFFYRLGPNGVHDGFTFEDCHVVGRFNHFSGQGFRTKWAVWGHSLKDFKFVGRRAPARVEFIKDEHGFYLQNPKGDVLIENVRAQLLGRTFCQFTSRAKEGPPGVGDIVVRNCEVIDVGIAAGDGYKGGAAFTIAGRHTGTILLENNTYRAGFGGEPIRSLTLPGQPYGTGALAAWQGGENMPNHMLVLRDNDFEMASGCGDRPLVAIGGCTKVAFLGRNRFVSGGAFDALALDPVHDDGRLRSPANGAVFAAPTTQVEGSVTIRGKEATPEQLEEMRKPPPAPEKPAPGADRDSRAGDGGA